MVDLPGKAVKFKSPILYLLIIRPSEVVMQIAAIAYPSTHDTWITIYFFPSGNKLYLYLEVSYKKVKQNNLICCCIQMSGG